MVYAKANHQYNQKGLEKVLECLKVLATKTETFRRAVLARVGLGTPQGIPWVVSDPSQWLRTLRNKGSVKKSIKGQICKD